MVKELELKLKRTKTQINEGLTLNINTGNSKAFYEVLYTDTGKGERFLFALRLAFETKEEIKKEIKIKISVLEV